MSTRLLPSRSPQDVLSDLQAAIARADSVRGAVAYWTIAADGALSDDLLRRLRAPGFLCVDLHWPTNVDVLADLDVRGVALYLYLDRAAPGIETEASHPEKMPAALMHTKTWLFERKEAAELWVGSHNFTRRAMSGANLEATLAVDLSPGDDLHLAAGAMLDRIRALCERFDRTKIDYYKWLQGQNDAASTILTLEGADMLRLAGTRVLLLADHARHLKAVPRPDAPVVVVCLDVAGGDTVYEGLVTKSGDMARTDRQASPLAFPPMRPAWLRPGPAARLDDEEVVT